VDDVSGAPTIRVLIVDDDALVGSGLMMILGGAPDIEVVGQAGRRPGRGRRVGTGRTSSLMDIRMC
jgi:DNA-binding NarL/FixJ family response regulator